MRNSYYFLEFELDGKIYRRNIKIEKSSQNKEEIKQMLDEAKNIKIKKTTKRNYVHGQF